MQSLLQLGAKTETLFGERELRLGEFHTYYNGPVGPACDQGGAPLPTVAVAPAVELVRLPAGARVSELYGCLAMVGDYFIAEQIAVNEAVDLPVAAARMLGDAARVEVRDETVLIARFGDGTWGHWLVELLPKIALCERHAPGRFRYALAAAGLGQGGVWRERVLESMAAYGVEQDRLIMIGDDAVFDFANLFAVTPVLTKGVLHPDAIDLMISDVRGVEAHGPKPAKTALMRSDDLRRIDNLKEVGEVLADHGFTTVRIGVQSFAEQVAIFRAALTLFSVLGSGLSGLVYSPVGVRMVVASPDSWNDDFFHGVARTKSARWAEARGSVTAPHPEIHRMSAFHLPVAHLEAAIASLGV